MSGTLLIRLKGLGDIVHVLPSLQMLRATRPAEPLGFLCQKPFGAIVPASLGVKVFELRAGATFAETLALARRVRCQRYDRLFDLFGNPRTALLALLTGIPFRAGFDYRIRRWAYHATFTPPDPNLHLTALFGQFLAHFGCGGPLGHPRLEWTSADEALARELLRGRGRPLLGMNPHTTYPSKAWPLEHYRDLAKRWHAATGQPVLVFWGPGEEDTARRLVADLGPARAFTHPALTIPQFVALLARLDLLVTADTGPMNIAWALDVPTVALFGPTTRRAVAPRGPRHLVLHHPDLACLECHREVCPDGRCLRELTPDLVWRELWAKHSSPSVHLPPEAGRVVSPPENQEIISDPPSDHGHGPQGATLGIQGLAGGPGRGGPPLESSDPGWPFLRSPATGAGLSQNGMDGRWGAADIALGNRRADPSARRAAVFLDRDGTLNPDPGYISRPEDFELFPGVGKELRRLRDQGFLLVLVTNQSGVVRGLISPGALAAVHTKLKARLAEDGVTLDGIYVCPHHPEFPPETVPNLCLCRKPAPGLILQAAADLGIDLGQSFAVGDRMTDVQMAVNAGVRPVLVTEAPPAIPPIEGLAVAGSLREAVDLILGHLRAGSGDQDRVAT